MTLNRNSLLLFIVGLTMCIGCNKESSLRTECIYVFTDEDQEEETKIVDVNYKGEKGSIYIKSNVDYLVSFQEDVHNHEKDWITFTEKRFDPNKNCNVIDFEAKPMDKSLKRLSGILKLTSPENYYGKFIVIRQGFNDRYSNDLNFLKYGSKDPLVSGKERAFEFWNKDQKEKHPFETTVIEGQEHSHLYGRNGFIQLGNDECYGADITIPYVTEIRRDSAIVVSLNALAMPGDDNRLMIEVIGGGVFDGTNETVKKFEASQFNNDSESIWDGSLKSWVISSIDKNPITTETRIRITAGELGRMKKNNRILLDNINVFSLPREAYDKVLAEGEK